MAHAGIVVEHLKKSYKNVEVLKDVTFEIEKGSIFALLGKNGAGKTTTINILTTLIKSDEGSATINGINVAQSPDKIRRDISLTGQFAAIDDMLTARENLVLIGDLRHVEDSRKTAEDLLLQFSLTDAADRRVQTFSGGMRRRLDIAMSLIGSPSVIFLDEPTTGLDPEARNDMWHTIRTLSKNGTTVFLTTQYLEEADQLADTIAVLHKGTVVAKGTASELKQLLPAGHIELHFVSPKETDLAQKVLSTYTATRAEPTIIKIASSGKAKQIADIFMKLGAAHLEPTEFIQSSPTLDDVFFKITNDQKEKK